MRPVALLPALTLAVVGCRGPDLKTLDGEWPIPPVAPHRPPPLVEVAGGEGAAFARGGAGGGGGARLLRAGALDDVEVDAPLGHLVACAGRRLWAVERGALVTRAVGGKVGPAEVVLEAPLAEGARAVAACAAGAAPRVALARPGDVVLVEGVGAAARDRVLWAGEAVALAFEPDGDALWLAARAPLAVVERVRVADGAVLLRAPLPAALVGGALELVAAPGAAVVHAADRPLEAGLVLADRTDRPAGAPLGTLWAPAGAPWSAHPAATPRLLLPPAGGDAAPQAGGRRGRVARLGGDFLVVSAAPGGEPTLERVVPPAPGAPTLSRTAIRPPSDWPRRVEVVTWDDDGATLASSEAVLTVDARGRTDVDHLTPRVTLHGVLRKALNWPVTLTLATAQYGVALAGNAAASAFMPLGAPFALLFDPTDAAWFGCLTGPLWFPLAETFDVAKEVGDVFGF